MNEKLQQAIANINKAYGKGSVFELGTSPKLDIEVIPTGCLGIDVALGIGGFPRGRIVEVYGPESGGKTTLCLHVIAQAQKMGLVAGFIDAEHSLDSIYAKNLGIDIDRLLVSQPSSGEEALEIALALVQSGAVGLIVVDSVAALVPRAELEGEMGQAQMGLQARLMSQAMRKLVAEVAKSKTSLVFINQIREKIGVMFGSPETTSGGRALKFAASIRIDIRRKGSATGEAGAQTGSPTKAKMVKNKCAPPFREAEFEIIYGEGISRESGIINYAAEKGLIDKSGAWLTIEKQRLQGSDNAIKFLKENPQIADKLEAALRDIYFPKSGK